RGRRLGGRGGRACRAAGVHLRARAGGDLPFAGAEVERRRKRAGRRTRADPLRRRATGAARAARRRRLRLSARPPRAHQPRGAVAGRAGGRAVLWRGRRRGGAGGSARSCTGCAGSRGHGMSGSGSLADELAAVTRLWAQLRVADRARYLERAAQAVIDEFDELCPALAVESGRPSAEIAALELLAAIDAMRWMAENAQRLLGAHRFALPRALHP